MHTHMEAALLRLYRRRNLVMHAGRIDAVASRAALRTTAQIVGAAFDRIAHAWVREQCDPDGPRCARRTVVEAQSYLPSQRRSPICLSGDPGAVSATPPRLRSGLPISFGVGRSLLESARFPQNCDNIATAPGVKTANLQSFCKPDTGIEPVGDRPPRPATGSQRCAPGHADPDAPFERFLPAVKLAQL